VRFATEKYSNSKDDLTKKLIHLTNFSVNKDADNYVYNDNPDVRESDLIL
jgi:tubulin polyglutamylase TTLL4